MHQVPDSSGEKPEREVDHADRPAFAEPILCDGVEHSRSSKQGGDEKRTAVDEDVKDGDGDGGQQHVATQPHLETVGDAHSPRVEPDDHEDQGRQEDADDDLGASGLAATASSSDEQPCAQDEQRHQQHGQDDPQQNPPATGGECNSHDARHQGEDDAIYQGASAADAVIHRSFLSPLLGKREQVIEFDSRLQYNIYRFFTMK